MSEIFVVFFDRNLIRKTVSFFKKIIGNSESLKRFLRDSKRESSFEGWTLPPLFLLILHYISGEAEGGCPLDPVIACSKVWETSKNVEPKTAGFHGKYPRNIPRNYTDNLIVRNNVAFCGKNTKIFFKHLCLWNVWQKTGKNGKFSRLKCAHFLFQKLDHSHFLFVFAPVTR